MKVKMTKEELLNLNYGMKNLSNLQENMKFSYGLTKNKRMIKNDVEVLDETREKLYTAIDWYTEFQEKAREININFQKKIKEEIDPTKKKQLEDANIKEIKKMEDKNPKLLKDFEEKREEFNKFLKEEIEIELFKIKQENFPELTSKVTDLLFHIIEE